MGKLSKKQLKAKNKKKGYGEMQMTAHTEKMKERSITISMVVKAISQSRNEERIVVRGSHSEVETTNQLNNLIVVTAKNPNRLISAYWLTDSWEWWNLDKTAEENEKKVGKIRPSGLTPKWNN